MQDLNDRYADRGVRALVINVAESPDQAAAWKEDLEWDIPVLLDEDGFVAESFAPQDLLPDLPRFEVPIASNLIIDRQGRIQFYELLDSRRFDAKLVKLRARLDQLLEGESQ